MRRAKNEKAVAVRSARGGGRRWSFQAPLRQFLDEIGYWREHDACAQKQGKLILQYLAGDRSVLPEIAALAARIDDMREALYCK